MELLDNLALGLGTALQPENVLYCLIGVVLGTAVGVLPGIGPTATIAMLLPITFSLEPVAALIMLAGIYYGAQYEGSTTAILINLPGETSAAVTAIDGHEMALKGRDRRWPRPRSARSSPAPSPPSCSPCSPAPGPRRAPVRPRGVLLARRARAARVDRAGARFDPEGAGDDRPGDPAGDGGAGHLHRHAPLRVRCPRAVRRPQLRLGGGRDVRRRRDPPQPRGRENPHRRGGEGEEPVADKETCAAWWRQCCGRPGSDRRSASCPAAGVLAAFASYSVEKRLSKHPEEFGHGAIEGVAGPESANNAAARPRSSPS